VYSRSLLYLAKMLCAHINVFKMAAVEDEGKKAAS